jgi:predicted amidophosphoribosyltransferase
MDPSAWRRDHPGFATTIRPEERMRFFRRKRSDDEPERCPRCRERVPERAAECMMCGLPLDPCRAAQAGEEAKALTDRSP